MNKSLANAGLTKRDLDLLETLTRRVRILRLEQVRQVWWPHSGSTSTLRRRLEFLQAVGLLEWHRLNAPPESVLTRPRWRWKLAEDEPDFEQIATAAKQRTWLRSEPTEVCVASKLAANLWGSTAAGLPRLEQRPHDLQLGQVYVWYRLHHPRLCRGWLGEHALPKAGYREKDPDAFLVDAQGQKRRAIEAWGQYTLQHLTDFHAYCVEHDLDYELW